MLSAIHTVPAKLRVSSHQMAVSHGFREGIGLTTRDAERYNRALDRRDGRVVEGTPLLREHTPKKCIEGSNPSLSARINSLYQAVVESYLRAVHKSCTNAASSFARSR